jgi:hypothetical protein
MAQDFYSAFNLGEDAYFINSVDVDGIALSAIQGLYILINENENKIENLEKRLAIVEKVVIILSISVLLFIPITCVLVWVLINGKYSKMQNEKTR